MLNFFHKIRQQLIRDNKVTRYLIYALGEIVLVVIGILIALQINNWNQGRLEAKKEKVYLENLERDLKNQIVSIDLQLEYEKKYAKCGTQILNNYFATQTLVFDSVMSNDLSTLTERKTFVRIDPTFEDMVSTGNIVLLKNNNLRNALIEYYQELERVEKVIQNNNTLHTDEGFGNKMSDIVFVGDKSTDRLNQISAALLQEPEREMKFITLIEKRTNIANNHIGVMDLLCIKTKEILKLLHSTRR